MKASIPLLLLALAGAASAADTGFYTGGAWSTVSGDYAPTRRIAGLAGTSGIPVGSIDTRDLKPLGASAKRAFAGYRLFDWLAIEGDYNHFAGNSGRTGIICVAAPCPSRERSAVNSSSLAVLGLYPRGPVDFFARAGVMQWRATLDLFNPDESALGISRDSGSNLAYGAGVQFHAKWLLTRLEYQRLKFGADEADLFSLGFAYAF